MTNPLDLDTLWRDTDTVMLDLDGTLLDLHYDNHFWFTLIPKFLAEKRQVSVEQARVLLEKKVSEYRGTLKWYCLEFWSEQLDLDIIGIKKIETERIRPRADALTFLANLKKTDKQIWLTTNSHPAGLDIKLSIIDIAGYFDCIISSHQFGFAKEHPQFWRSLYDKSAYRSDRTLFIDDSEPVLRAAKEHGIRYPVMVETPDSRKPRNKQQSFHGIDRFTELQLPTKEKA